MPQMAPINWLSLFIVFLIVFMVFMYMNYFIYTPLMPKSNLMDKKCLMNSFNWKW